jgi:hypothetical protein
MRINSATTLSQYDCSASGGSGRLAEVPYPDASSYPGYKRVNFRMPSGVTPGPAICGRLIYLSRQAVP